MSQSHTFTITSPYQAYCYNSWLPGRGLKKHGHQCLQIFHVLKGDFEVNVGQGWQKIKPGTAHILPPGFSHALRSEKGDTHFSLTFGQRADERGLIQHLCAAFIQPQVQPVTLPSSLQAFLESPPLLFDEMTQLWLVHLFDGYCMNLLTERHQGHTEIRKQQLLSFLETQSTQVLTVEQIAKAMQMSRSSLQRFCAQTFGCGVRSLHERIRIENASRLLVQSQMPVSQCALECGYSDIYAFSRSFKRAKGRSPQAFRFHSLQTD